MTEKEALKILDSVTANIPLNRKDTFLVVEALKVLNALVEKTQAPNAPRENKA